MLISLSCYISISYAFIFPISVKKEIGIQNLLNSLLKLAFIGDWHNFSNKITNKSDYFLSKQYNHDLNRFEAYVSDNNFT